MKVILTQTVQGLGDAGAIKEVADGYARNFLLPKGLAVAATRGSIKQAAAQAELYARKADKARSALQGSAAAVQDKTVTIRARAGSENRLYGSVTPADLAEVLQAQLGVSIDRRKLHLDEPIHRLGTYTATADFGNGVTAKFNVEVAPEVAGAQGGKPVKAAATMTETAEAEESEGAGEESSGAGDSLADVAEETVSEGGLTESGQSVAEQQAEASPS
jgi:large subunit ribosomal protein L9